MNNLAIRVSLLAAAAALTACTAPKGGPGAAATVQPVTIVFDAQIGGKPFSCGQSYAGIGTTRSTITPSDYRFYVSEVHLIDRAGRAVPVTLMQDQIWQFENIALLDFENGTGPCRNGTAPTNTTVRGTVPAGDYTGLRFTLGVPFNRNHGDPTTAPAPLNLTAMFWNWQGGYKFIKFDTATSGQPRTSAPPDSRGGGNASGFSVHLGSTVCASASRTQAPSACQNPNRLTVTFDRFNINHNVVVADIGAVLEAANVDVNAPGTSPGCMSFPNDPDCPAVMSALGLPYGAAPAGQQRFFTVK
jgi:uncharacterized repeat protein (TIGR04052 family)